MPLTMTKVDFTRLLKSVSLTHRGCNKSRTHSRKFIFESEFVGILPRRSAPFSNSYGHSWSRRYSQSRLIISIRVSSGLEVFTSGYDYIPRVLAGKRKKLFAHKCKLTRNGIYITKYRESSDTWSIGDFVPLLKIHKSKKLMLRLERPQQN
jgi:hypothetical protein